MMPQQITLVWVDWLPLAFLLLFLILFVIHNRKFKYASSQWCVGMYYKNYINISPIQQPGRRTLYDTDQL